MDRTSFYDDRKFCDHCAGYVPYLASLERSYCAHCGAVVRLMSATEWRGLQDSLEQRKARVGHRGSAARQCA